MFCRPPKNILSLRSSLTFRVVIEFFSKLFYLIFDYGFLIDNSPHFSSDFLSSCRINPSSVMDRGSRLLFMCSRGFRLDTRSNPHRHRVTHGLFNNSTVTHLEHSFLVEELTSTFSDLCLDRPTAHWKTLRGWTHGCVEWPYGGRLPDYVKDPSVGDSIHSQFIHNDWGWSKFENLHRNRRRRESLYSLIRTKW